MKLKKSLEYGLSILLLLCVCYGILGTPVQELKVTAVTQNSAPDLSGTTGIYELKPLEAGKTYKAVIRFMAVKNTSEKLFVSYGTGPYVHLGCSELKAECEFLSLGWFLHLRLQLQAAQTDFKLEDGTPFDITRYSLKPVLTLEELEP